MGNSLSKWPSLVFERPVPLFPGWISRFGGSMAIAPERTRASWVSCLLKEDDQTRLEDADSGVGD